MNVWTARLLGGAAGHRGCQVAHRGHRGRPTRMSPSASTTTPSWTPRSADTSTSSSTHGHRSGRDRTNKRLFPAAPRLTPWLWAVSGTKMSPRSTISELCPRFSRRSDIVCIIASKQSYRHPQLQLIDARYQMLILPGLRVPAAQVLGAHLGEGPPRRTLSMVGHRAPLLPQARRGGFAAPCDPPLAPILSQRSLVTAPFCCSRRAPHGRHGLVFDEVGPSLREALQGPPLRCGRCKHGPWFTRYSGCARRDPVYWHR